jgi:hypothetical protein
MGIPVDSELLKPVPMAPTDMVAAAADKRTRSGTRRAKRDQNSPPGTCPKANVLAVNAAKAVGTPWSM